MQNNFDYLIGLNSFIDFLGSEHTMRNKRQKELKALQSSLLKDATSTMKKFYTRCGSQELIECTNFSNLDLNLILSDLHWLQKKYAPPTVPTLIISSHDDIIVPNTITLDNFSEQPVVKIDYIKNAGHALGHKKPLDVYERIISFLNDNKV